MADNEKLTEAEQERAAQAPDAQPGLEQAPAVAGADQVQDKMNAITDKGYQGHTPDPTPDSHYTVAGVLAGLPTPENDAGQAAKADAAARDLAAQAEAAADPKGRKAAK